ncbi:thermonuclease family protein [Robiginitalea aurantiaca]|uniref:Thermonuclease family protein n=1 Tax=Robiginitalea aurantiaca TaxID=3056915 RepID=A0ABT7WGT1_9FLAO|nr:thermonuclease family protein [Robiginitalea aurantiaca]MDM9632126.1 thermonuclease family protein [Robiginitalea aurantiaca]
MTLRICLLFFLLCSTACRPTTTKEQDTLQGKVVGIADGDTFTLLLDNKTTVKVRLASIDCPERKQPYSAVATKFISDAIFSRQVSVVVDSKDRYGRSIGWVYYDDKCLNEELLKAGLAWHFRRYSKDERLQAMEDKARANKIGLWQDSKPIPPWDWRRGVRD